MAGTSSTTTFSHSYTILCIFTLLYRFSFDYAGAALHSSVETHHGLISREVILGCNYTLPKVDIENIDIWWKVSKNGISQTLFSSQNEIITKYTKGFYVDERWLLKGSASLWLKNATISNEGIYSCGVIIQPDQYNRTIHLKLSAQPLISLPELVTVMTGEEKTLRCDITRFYPEQLKVSWKIQGGKESASWDVCTGIPVPNNDGTFNVSSRITVKADTLKSDDTVYVCQIKHRSFPEIYRRNITVKLQDAVHPFNMLALIGGTVTSSVLLTVLAIGGAAILYRHFRGVPISVSDITKPDIIYAKTATKLSCTIRGVRHKHLKVQWYKMPSCNSGSCEAALDSTSETDSIIGMENLQDQTELQLEGKVHLSMVSLILTINDDNREYRCVVHFGQKKIIKKTTVNVKVNPDLQISTQPQIPKLGQLLVLCCRIEKFYPENIRLEWRRQGKELLQPDTQFGPFLDHEQLYSLWSKTELIVTNVDIGTVCTCRVYHSSFPAPFYKDVPYHINIDGQPPNVAFIKCDPPWPQIGIECTLNLCVKDFCPGPVTITWFKNAKKISDGAFNSPASLNINGLYSMWTFLKLTPSEENLSSVFKCLVEHSAQLEPEERHFTLAHIMKV